MPRVPVLQQQVATAPLPGARLTPDAPAGAFAPPAPVDLSGAAEFFARERQKADQVAVLDADNELSDVTRQLHADAMQRRGRDALGAVDTIDAAWSARAGAIEQRLQGDGQKLAFRQRAVARRASLLESVETHAAAERRAFDDETTTTAVQGRLDDALRNYQDPAKVSGALAELRAIVIDHGRRTGAPTEAIAARVATFVSKAHTAVIDRMLSNGQDLAATDYYGKVKGEIVGADTLSVEKALETGSVMGDGQRRADAIMATAGLTEKEAFERARAIQDPKVREETEKRLDTEFRRRDAQERDQRIKLFQQGADYAEQGRRPPAPIWANLTLQERSAIDERIKQLAAGTPAKTDDAIYYRLVRAAATNPQAFAKENLAVYFPYLASSDRQELARMQASAIKGDDKNDERLTGIRTSQRIVDDALLSIGVDPTPDPRKNKGDVDKSLQFRRAVDDEVRALEQRTQKKATPDDVQAISDRLLTTGAVVGTGGFFSGPTHRRVFEQQAGERLVITAADIPRGERVRLEAAIRSAGGVVTDATVLKLYTRTIGRMLKPAAAP